MSLKSKLKEDIEIYRKAVADNYKKTETWVYHTTVKGLTTLLNSFEKTGNDGKEIDADTKAIVFPVDITEEDRIKADGNYYDIYSIKDPNKKGKFFQVKMKKLKPGIMS